MKKLPESRFENESAHRVSLAENLFPVFLLMTVALFGTFGLVMHNRGKVGSSLVFRSSDEIAARFIMEEPKKTKQEIVTPPAPKKEKKKEKKKEEKKVEKPVDLTKKPEAVPEKKPEETQPDPPEQEKPKRVRKVYGLKKVYSKGLGSGGNAGDAVVGKIGNTLDKDFDTLTATKEDLKEKPVSVATITSYPKLKSGFGSNKPEYTEEMIENRIEGMVKAKLLIDAQGKVKKVIVTKDLGYGSKTVASQYLAKLEFEPAKANGKPVPVWIPFSIRFELLEG